MKLPNDYQNFIALSRYARWLPEKNRRETWEETVARYFNFMEEHLKENTDYELDTATRKKLEHAVLNLDIMPSMRALMTAGAALSKNHIAGYNCAYLSVDHPKAFDECLYILIHFYHSLVLHQLFVGLSIQLNQQQMMDYHLIFMVGQNILLNNH